MTKAVLLLHGFATNHTDFAPIVEELKKRYDLVVNDDLPGHSSNKGLRGFTLHSTFGYIDTKVKELIANYDEVDVIGFSMGGALATYVGSNYAVHKLVLLAPANIYINAKYPFQRLKKFFEYLNAKHLPNISKIERSLKLAEYNEVLLEDEDAIKITKKYILPNYNIRTIREFMHIIKYCGDNLTIIKVPTLIIMGDMDQLVSDKSALYIEEYCENVKVITFENVSHMMLRSRRKKVIIKSILEFLDN